MGKSIRTTSNTQTTILAHRVSNGLTDDGLSMAQIITLALTSYAKEVAK